MKVLWEKESGWYWIDSQGRDGYFATCRSALENYITEHGTRRRGIVMTITKLPPGTVTWHLGKKLDIAIGKTYSLNRNGTRTKVNVYIRDKDGELHHRIGDGRQMGNFHPIWINWKGKKVTIEELMK